jgi:aspartokinase/homoserine dehydrogenase 1
MHTQDIFILGATGKVGRTLIAQIFRHGDDSLTLHRNPTRIVGVASSSRFRVNPDGLSPEDTTTLPDRHGSVLDLLGIPKDPVIFVDVTAARLEEFHVKARELGHGVVTANKNPLVDCSFPTFETLTSQPRRYGYRCSVMAGAEAVGYVRDLRDLDDRPTEISGCFSGTLGFVCAELEKGRKISEIVREARAKGYTEPHPADDLGGMDVARKLCILARSAGFDIGLGDIKVWPFIPAGLLAQRDVNLFLSSLEEVDANFARLVSDTARDGNVLRYVASLEVADGKPTATTRIQPVSRQSPLGALQGTLNKIVVRTATQEGKPYSVEAQGAGLEITARNIRRDLLDQLADREVRR